MPPRKHFIIGNSDDDSDWPKLLLGGYYKTIDEEAHEEAERLYEAGVTPGPDKIPSGGMPDTNMEV